MRPQTPPTDIIIAGTFAAWKLGTLQARALPFARELNARGVSCAIVTVPWDMSSESGVVDTVDGVALRNSVATRVTSFPIAVAEQTRLIRELQPRAVHVFKPKGFGGLAGRLLASTIPLLVDSDDWEGDGGWNQAGRYSFFQRRMFHWQEQTLLRDARAVTAASHLLARRAMALRATARGTVTWIPNGLTEEWARRLSGATALANQDGLSAPTVVLYSRFAEFAADWLQRYLSRLSTLLSPTTIVNVNVIVIGEAGDIPHRFVNLNVDLMGYVAHSVIETTLPRATIAIYPYADSLISRSKSSVKLLELMAAGCAVIASRTGDVPAVAGDTAVLLDGAQPEAFATATVDLLGNQERVQRLSSMARGRAVTVFNIPSITTRLIAAYRNAGVLNPCWTE